jgi:hypothetical protein
MIECFMMGSKLYRLNKGLVLNPLFPIGVPPYVVFTTPSLIKTIKTKTKDWSCSPFEFVSVKSIDRNSYKRLCCKVVLTFDVTFQTHFILELSLITVLHFNSPVSLTCQSCCFCLTQVVYLRFARTLVKHHTHTGRVWRDPYLFFVSWLIKIIGPPSAYPCCLISFVF